MVKIAASLHSGPKLHMSEILDQLKKADVDLLHIDAMDSIFVPEIDFGSNFTKEISQYTDIPLDIHMMVNNPSRLINEYALSTTTDIGIHYEATQQLHRDLFQIKQLNKKAEVIINPGTPINSLSAVLNFVDQIMVMSVDPGCSGKSPFIPEVASKIKKLDQLRKEKNYHYLIEADGGITDKNLKVLVDNGLDIAVSGSFIFNGDIRQQVQKLKEIK